MHTCTHKNLLDRLTDCLETYKVFLLLVAVLRVLEQRLCLVKFGINQLLLQIFVLEDLVDVLQQ